MVKVEKIMMVLAVMSVLVLVSLALGCTSATVKQYTMATGGISGTYYPIGIGIATSANDSKNFAITVEDSKASVANCNLLKTHGVDFALIQNDVAYAAQYLGDTPRNVSGTNMTMIKGVACLYPETIQLFTLNDSGIKNVKDLKGKRVIMGDRGSGSWFNALDILKAYGLNESDVINPGAVAVATAADMMKNGQVDAAFWTGGAPTNAITELDVTHDVYLVPISGPERDALIASQPFYARQKLPAGTYTGITWDTETVSIMAMLVVHQNVSEQDVHDLLVDMYDGSHPIYNYTNAVAKKIQKANAMDGMSIPLHPGAKKYFDEQGIKTP